MPDLKTVIAGLPGIKQIISNTEIDGLIEATVADAAAQHRWTFLKETDRSLTWTSATGKQSFPNLTAIENLEAPDGSNYFQLEEMSDQLFKRWKALNPDDTNLRVWRPAGYDGNKLRIEVYGTPAVGTVLKCDYYAFPTVNNQDSLPAYFNLLIIQGVKAAVGIIGMFDYERQLQRAVTKDQNVNTGKRRRMGRDAIQASRFRNINNPS